jgi:hypothetical protein
MKIMRYKPGLFSLVLTVMMLCSLTSCNTKSYSKNKDEHIGFSNFYLDMDYLKVKSVMDSLLKTGELHYFETADVVGTKQKNLYCDFPGISPSLCAKVNLRGSYIIDERLTSIQLTLCTRSHTEDGISFSCYMNDIKKLFESYGEKYGKPTLLVQGDKYNWLSKKISNVYLPGPKGRLMLDKIYYWERGNYMIYFDFGYPKSTAGPGDQAKGSDAAALNDSTSAPIIYYDFTPEYIDRLLEKASSKKEKDFKKPELVF